MSQLKVGKINLQLRCAQIDHYIMRLCAKFPLFRLFREMAKRGGTDAFRFVTARLAEPAALLVVSCVLVPSISGTSSRLCACMRAPFFCAVGVALCFPSLFLTSSSNPLYVSGASMKAGQQGYSPYEPIVEPQKSLPLVVQVIALAAATLALILVLAATAGGIKLNPDESQCKEFGYYKGEK
jgi:hypothetical protein